MIDRMFRTIDLHTSEQIHQMRGRFDDALTMSLSSHGVHRETLNRIEQYSITSMRSSAYSLKSMDSIRSELSRLETMITSSRATSTSRIEQYETDVLGSSAAEGRSNHLQPTHEGVSFRARGHVVSGHPLEPSESQESCKNSSNASHRSRNISSSERTDSDRGVNIYTHPADYHVLVKEQETISKRFSEISTGHGSALLYAQFSRTTAPAAKISDTDIVNMQIFGHDVEAADGLHKPDPTFSHDLKSSPAGRSGGSSDVPSEHFLVEELQRPRSAQTSNSEGVHKTSIKSQDKIFHARNLGFEIDLSSTYNLLQESLAVMYPPIVADYLSLQDLVSSYQGHLKVLEETPIAMFRKSEQQQNFPGSVQPHIRKLRDRLEALQEAVDTAARGCVSAGWSMQDLDRLLLSATQNDLTPAAPESSTLVRTTENFKEDEVESEGSDIYLSATE